MSALGITINIKLSSGSNNAEGEFNGIAYLESGFLRGGLQSDSFAEHERTLLSALTLTGCPIAARSESSSINPWRETAGAYTSTRSISTDEFELTSHLHSEADGASINMTLEAQYDGTIPQLVAFARPFQEEIRQSDLGQFIGFFEPVFVDRQGHQFKATARTSYSLNCSKKYPTVWRNISIFDDHHGSKTTQTEQIDLFARKSDANKDLERKTMIGLVQ